MTNYYKLLTAQATDEDFTYSSEEDLQPGQLVIVTFRSRKLQAMVIKRDEANDFAYQVKSIEKILPLQFTKSRMQFLEFMAQYNMIPRGSVLKMMLPQIDAFTQAYQPQQHNFAPKSYELSTKQEEVFGEISKKINNGFSVTVLEGVTGSGKTEVFLKAVIELMSQGHQVLVLLPEIVLTSQLIDRFTEKLNYKPHQWHSGLSKKQRRETLQGVISGDVKLVVGARSALLLPYKDLKLVVVDEEHDSSYKQEEGAIYNARDMALALAKYTDIAVLLSSATPSMESYYNIKQGKFGHLVLSERFSKVELPELLLVDLELERKANKFWITTPLRQQILSAIAKGKQVLLFLNRRGFAPVTMCKECDAKISCRNCNAYLVYHKKKQLLKCHHCGYSEKMPSSCPACGCKSDFVNIGLGVERICEEVASFVDNPRIALLTSDTLGSREKITQELARINEGEVDIIVGTQLITKGLHFSNLHLVGVIDADASVIGGDIRALERTYQLLHQVSGRAGREADRGLVIIQTRHPNSPIMQHLISPDKHEFIDAELINREVVGMPPYKRLVTITMAGYNEFDVIDAAQTLARFAPFGIDGISVMGPSPAPLFYLNRRYRYRFIIVAEKSMNVQKIIKQWLAAAILKRSVRVRVDIDPMSFI